MWNDSTHAGVFVIRKKIMLRQKENNPDRKVQFAVDKKASIPVSIRKVLCREWEKGHTFKQMIYSYFRAQYFNLQKLYFNVTLKFVFRLQIANSLNAKDLLFADKNKAIGKWP